MQRLDRIFLAITFFLPLILSAQVEATLTALENTIQVGKPFMVELSVRHPEDVVVIFPDSAGDFAPFEWVNTDPKPTSTSNGTSVDAALIHLVTWEIDSVQFLQFPVRFLASPTDTLAVLTNKVEVLFQPMIAVYSDTLKLKMHGGLTEIREPFPWLGVLIVFIFFALVATLLLILLRKPVGKWFRRIKVRREWEKFKRGHQEVLASISKQEEFTEKLQHNWKSYFDTKGRFKLKAMTTPELMTVLADSESLSPSDIEELIALGNARDQLVFGGYPVEEGLLRDLHGKIETIMAKEFVRRKEAAEV